MKKLHFLFLFLTFFSCQKSDVSIANEPEIVNQKYAVLGSKILKYGQPIQLVGANAMHSFGVGSADMTSWNLDITREFIGNIKENPISGNPIQDSNGSWLHSLQKIVDDNRINNKITILGAFGWDGNPANEFSGKRPTQQLFWNDFKLKLKQWSIQFKDQPDVWIEIWNEPYTYNRSDGYTDGIWQSDMSQLVAIIRAENNNNIILVPCAEQGQDESVLNNIGTTFLIGKSNILFDIHAYEKWLLVADVTIENRLNTLKNNNLPVFFGEIAPMNAGVLMHTNYFLNSIYNKGLSVCGWLWKYDATDKDALLTSSNQPNDTNNNNWGSTFKNIALQVRKP
jgi:mannan endo-1,4-beta-mannosidase